MAAGGVALDDLATRAAAVEPGRGRPRPGRRARARTAPGRRDGRRSSAAASRSTCSPPSTDLDEDELIAVLRDLVARGLLVETEPDVFGFRHDLAREAIEQRLLGREQRRIHQAALDALHGRRQPRPSPRWPTTPRAPAGPTRWSTWPGGAAARYLAIGSTYQALELAELGLTEADPTTPTCGPPPPRRGLARRALRRTPSSTASASAAQADAAGDLDRPARRPAALLARLYWETGRDADSWPRRSSPSSTTSTCSTTGPSGPPRPRGPGPARDARQPPRRGPGLGRSRPSRRPSATALPSVRRAALVEQGSAHDQPPPRRRRWPPSGRCGGGGRGRRRRRGLHGRPGLGQRRPARPWVC